MNWSTPAYFRIEPTPGHTDYADAIAARIHDPFWFLARQRQLGEHQGENATTPVRLSYRSSELELSYAISGISPTVTPAESIVESEPDDWWTMGRRLRAGSAASAARVIPDDLSLRFTDPPPPYEHFVGRPDGLALWRRRAAADLNIPDAAFGAQPPVAPMSAWDDRELLYEQSDADAFDTVGLDLRAHRHRGGRMDWYSVRAAPGAQPGIPAVETARDGLMPTRLEYPGMPLRGWWELEATATDIAATSPDAAHTPTAIMTELHASHSDEWFIFPVMGQAGTILTIETVEVADSFGRHYSSEELVGPDPRWSGLRPPLDWTLFHTDGLEAADLLLWHVAEIPLESGSVERVQFGLDDESNLLWAVERIIDAREAREPESVAEGTPFNPGLPSGDTTARRSYVYVPGQGAAPHWIPYDVDDVDYVLVQRRLIDYSVDPPNPLPLPRAAVLTLDDGTAHRIHASTIPSGGIELERRWQLARDMTGAPVLWMQRQRRPLLNAPARRLRFDVADPARAAKP